MAKAINLPQDKQRCGKVRTSSVSFQFLKRTVTNTNQLTLITGKHSPEEYYRYGPQDKPREWERFREYCIQDVVVERELRKRLMAYPLPETEKTFTTWTNESMTMEFGLTWNL